MDDLKLWIEEFVSQEALDDAVETARANVNNDNDFIYYEALSFAQHLTWRGVVDFEHDNLLVSTGSDVEGGFFSVSVERTPRLN